MRVVVVTSFRHGVASLALPALIASPEIEIAGVIYCEAHYRSRKAKLKRDLKKMLRIGPFGVLAGLWLRRWYRGVPTEDLFDLAQRHDLTVECTPRTNAPRTRELLTAADADLGLSLGNSYIAPRVFRIPRLGMLNVHGEILPRFKGAQSVIWPIHEGVTETGFSIHEVSKRIDAGLILYRESFPILLRPTLGQTIAASVTEISRRVPPALAQVVANFEHHRSGGEPNAGGQSYTTPTGMQFLRMVRQHRRMWREAAAHSGNESAPPS